MPCGHLLGWHLGSRLWCLIVKLSLSPMVFWVRCVAWLYRLLIFVLFSYFRCVVAFFVLCLFFIVPRISFLVICTYFFAKCIDVQNTNTCIENLSGGSNNKRHMLACASAKTGHCLFYSLIKKYHIETCYKRNFNYIGLQYLCSWSGSFESHFVGNPKRQAIFTQHAKS